MGPVPCSNRALYYVPVQKWLVMTFFLSWTSWSGRAENLPADARVMTNTSVVSFLDDLDAEEDRQDWCHNDIPNTSICGHTFV